MSKVYEIVGMVMVLGGASLVVIGTFMYLVHNALLRIKKVWFGFGWATWHLNRGYKSRLAKRMQVEAQGKDAYLWLWKVGRGADYQLRNVPQPYKSRWTWFVLKAWPDQHAAKHTDWTGRWAFQVLAQAERGLRK